MRTNCVSPFPYLSPSTPPFFAFNIWDIPSAKAVMDAAAKVGRPIILQTSMKAFSLMDLEEMRFFVTNYARKKGISVYLHLDHCKKQEMIRQALDAGWDSVMIDASERPLSENVELTNQVTEMAHAVGVLVESEVGQVSGVEDEISVSGSGVARMEDVERFVRETKVDMLAVAIGTAHGQYHGEPHLHYDILAQTAEITKIPLVIHGGTGLSDEVLRKLLSYPNVKKINVSTDVKQAYLRGIAASSEAGLLAEAGFDPLKVTTQIHDAIEALALKKLALLD